MFATSVARWVSLAAAVTCAACARNSAPKGWLPKPAQAQAAAYGGWIELTYQESGEKRQTDGELIAVSGDSVWVLNESRGAVIPTIMVQSGKLTAYAAQTGPLTTWTAVGALATLSNGAFLIFTAPMWLIGGSLTVRGESRSPERTKPPLTWMELAPFARFPQGMPEGVELTSLRPKAGLRTGAHTTVGRASRLRPGPHGAPRAKAIRVVRVPGLARMGRIC